MILNLNCSWDPQVAASKSQVSRATSYPAFARYASAPGNFLVGNSRRKEVISRPSASVHPSGRSFPASQLSGAAEEEKRPRRTLIDKKHDEIRAFVDTASILGDIAQHGTRDVLTDLFSRGFLCTNLPPLVQSRYTSTVWTPPPVAGERACLGRDSSRGRGRRRTKKSATG